MSLGDFGEYLAYAMVPVVMMAVGVFVVERFSHVVAMRGMERGVFYCRACRYNLRGITSWRCPECGADPRHAGVLTREKPALISLPGRMFLWVSAGPLVIVITSFIAALIWSDGEASGVVIGMGLWATGLFLIGWIGDTVPRDTLIRQIDNLYRFAEANGLPVDGIGDIHRSRSAS